MIRASTTYEREIILGKFHISEDGNPRPCTAAVCPLGGGEADHIDSNSMDEVREFAEKVNSARYEVFASVSRNGAAEAGFGSRGEREEALSPALKFYNEIWDHPRAGYSPPHEEFLDFYESHRNDYRAKLADGFDVSPKHVFLTENLAVIEKDGKFLALHPIGMYADSGAAQGSETTESELRDEMADEQYDLSDSEYEELSTFLDGRSVAAPAATSSSPQTANQALMAEVRDTFNYELSEFDGTDYDESLPVPSKAKANEVANRMLTMLEREELSEDDTMDMIVALSAANSEGRLDDATTERGHAVVDELIRQGKVQRGFHPYGVFGALED